MKYFMWLLKAAIFFTLFAFALNNQQDTTVHFFFGTQWRAPLVLVVLAAFALGLVVGALGMVPRWWKHRRRGAPLAPGHGRPAAAGTGHALAAWTLTSAGSSGACPSPSCWAGWPRAWTCGNCASKTGRRPRPTSRA